MWCKFHLPIKRSKENRTANYIKYELHYELTTTRSKQTWRAAKRGRMWSRHNLFRLHIWLAYTVAWVLLNQLQRNIAKQSQLEVVLERAVSYRFSNWPIRKSVCVAEMPQVEDVTEQFILQLRIWYHWDRTILQIKMMKGKQQEERVGGYIIYTQI